MTDMDKLIAAVEAGESGEIVIAIARSIPRLQYNIGKRDDADEVRLAHVENDLNAAKRLHDALLPGWHWEICSDDKPATAIVWNLTRLGRQFSGGHESNGNPARSWLLAILKAVNAQERKT